MKNEKAIISAKDYGSNTNLNNQLIMTNFTPKQFQTQPESRRDLFESSKLSRLPKLPSQTNFRLPDLSFPETVVVAVCGVCGGRLEIDNGFQHAVKICRKCLTIYSKVDLAFDEKEKRERRETLERFIGGAK